MSATGPARVSWGSPTGGPVLVLDPADIDNSRQLCAEWQDVMDEVRVVWLRLPANEFDPAAVLDVLDEEGNPFCLVAGGVSVAYAFSAAIARPERVRALLVVDPLFDGPGGEEMAPDQTIEWVRKHNIEVHLIADSRATADHDGIGLSPLGHPAVAHDVRAFLTHHQKQKHH